MSPVIVPAVIAMLAGLIVIWLAVQSWHERLTRNWIAGVRTPSTMRSDEAFRIANKAAAHSPAPVARSSPPVAWRPP